jgi:hypothetical protein
VSIATLLDAPTMGALAEAVGGDSAVGR